MNGKTIRGMAVVALAAVVARGGAPVSAQAKGNVTGKWAREVTTDAGGTTTPTVTFTQEGEKLTGRYESATLGNAEITGEVKGQAITFGFNADLQGTAVAVTYAGTIESATTMKGTIDLAGLATGTFSGKKQ